MAKPRPGGFQNVCAFGGWNCGGLTPLREGGGDGWQSRLQQSGREDGGLRKDHLDLAVGGPWWCLRG